MPRKKVLPPIGVLKEPKAQFTQCNFYLSEEFENKAKASRSKQTQTEILGTIIPLWAWNDLNSFAEHGKESYNIQKRKVECVDKETFTEELQQRKKKKIEILNRLSLVENYISSLDSNDFQMNYKKRNTQIEQLEVMLNDSLIPASAKFYDTPIRLLFALDGTLTVVTLFKQVEHFQYSTDIETLDENVMNLALSMLSPNHVFCTGISKIDCKNSTNKNLKTLQFPCERYQSTYCPVWFIPPKNVQEEKLKNRTYQCGKCKALNWYIKDRKKKNEMAAPSRKLECRTANSSCPISKLTPESRIQRFLANRRLRYNQRNQIKQLLEQLENARLELSGKQGEEMSTLASEVNRKGQKELNQNFDDAAAHNELTGGHLKRLGEKTQENLKREMT